MIDTATTTVIVGFLSFLGTMSGAYYGNKKSAALMGYRLQELEKKVDKHNQVIERTYKLEETAAILEEKIRGANHRLDDMEAKK